MSHVLPHKKYLLVINWSIELTLNRKPCAAMHLFVKFKICDSGVKLYSVKPNQFKSKFCIRLIF